MDDSGWGILNLGRWRTNRKRHRRALTPIALGATSIGRTSDAQPERIQGNIDQADKVPWLYLASETEKPRASNHKFWLYPTWEQRDDKDS